MTHSDSLPILELVPEYKDYVWGGDRLRPGFSPTAEAWVIYENDRIASGPLIGKSLADAAEAFGADLLGDFVVKQTSTRFPLLVKLLDCAQWLSLQVHPDDEQAARLEGPGFYGKTEAWHILEAAPRAQLIAGLKPGTTPATLAQSIRQGSILDWVQYVPVKAGDTIFMQPGTIHALGPGLLIYEVQQTSDLTYRVYDWGRPQTEKRKLHIDKSLAVARSDIASTAEPLPPIVDGDECILCQSRYFTLALLGASHSSIHLNTQGETFHALTVIKGRVRLLTSDGMLELGQYQSAIIPAANGEYHLEPLEEARVLKSSVESL
jgi:mannose-6-phosphate isomerase